jgi:HlyD family secretion protein
VKKFVLFVVLLSVCAAVTAYVYKQRTPGISDRAMGMERPVSVEVERDTIDLKVATTGKVVSNLDVEIKSKASGQITNLPYDVSDEITSGNLLCELDPVDELRNVAQREAQLSAAQARLEQAEQQLRIAQADVDTGTSTAIAEIDAATVKYRELQSRMERQQELYRQRLVSSEELDILRSELSAAERSLKNAQVRIAELKNLPRTVELRKQDVILNKTEVTRAEIEMQNALQRLKETKIFAPMDGVITSRPVQSGQIIASGISNVGGGTTLMTLSDLSRLFIDANVDESDIGKIKVGQKTTITADAFPGRRFTGEIVRVAAKGVTNSNVVTFEVKIEIDASGRDLLRPEMTANVDIQADRRVNALVLPNELIQFDDSGYYVMVAEDAQSSGTRKDIKPGITDGLKTEIVSGLEEGDKIMPPAMVQSRWARGGGERGGPGGESGSGLNRGMRSAAFRLSSSGRGGR